ncbi:MAG: class I SAM-dependent methyltransferase [Spirochaetes bacterium]|nr:class I SAM-dependent methyltransferase [Spirochaetota bacterium]
MGQDLNKISRVYNSLSNEYTEASSGEHEKKPKDREILDRFSREVGSAKPVWDFGCGSGHTAAYVKNLGVEISGLDLSELIIEQAKIKYPYLHFQQGNILELEFDNNSIAAVLSFYAIVHFTEDQVAEAFREIYRVIKPGGLFLFTYHIGGETIHLDEFLGKNINIDFMFFRNEFITLCLKKCGFGSIDLIEREPYPDIEYQSRRAYVFAKKPAD